MNLLRLFLTEYIFKMKIWFNMPFWYKKVGEGKYEEYQFEDLPEHLKNYLNENKNK